MLQFRNINAMAQSLSQNFLYPSEPNKILALCVTV